MAKPFGTATPSDARVEYSSPSDAVLPPTSPTSCHPISRNDLIYPDIRMNKSRRIRSVLRKVKAPPAWHRAVAAGRHQKNAASEVQASEAALSGRGGAAGQCGRINARPHL